MFKAVNPYEEVIAKATDEKQTEVNWDVLLTIWDKVSDDGEAGARNAVAALSKRLQHRSANVQLFSLTLAGALVNNCGAPLHREISGKAFTQTLVRLVNDRTTHDDVKKQTLKLIAEWAKEHEKNADFDLMIETYETLKKQNVKFEDDRPKSPPRRSDDALRREEEDLQRALAESAALADPRRGFASSSDRKQLPHEPSDGSFDPPANESAPLRSTTTAAPKRVRALYNFAPQTGEELGFAVGDVINVLECVYEAWWKGELRGQTGIFPANHVEPIKEDEKIDEAEIEAELFAQAASVDRLLAMMRGMSGKGENVADNDELIDLYQRSMSLRPKVVKLIERYEQKQADLQAMNQKFAKAASTYEAMVGQQRPAYASTSSQYAQPQPGPAQYGAQPPPAQGPPGQGQADPYAGWTEQQRREYDAQWAAYHEQMREYERAQADYQQQQLALSQQQQGGPPAPASQPQQQQPQGEPYWDGQQYVYPQQPAQPPAQQQQPVASAASPPPQTNGIVPAAAAAFYHPAQQAHYAQQQQQHAAGQAQPPAGGPASYPAQPYPDAALNDQMAQMSVNGGPPQPHDISHQLPSQDQYYHAAEGAPPQQGAYPPAVSPQLHHAGSPPPPPGQTQSHIYPAVQQQQPGGYEQPQYPAAAQPWGAQQ